MVDIASMIALGLCLCACVLVHIIIFVQGVYIIFVLYVYVIIVQYSAIFEYDAKEMDCFSVAQSLTRVSH